MKVVDEKYILKTGIEIPKIAFGTWQIKPEDSYEAVKNALKAGYHHIDTALAYQNEEGCGKAIKEFGRDKVFVTTKLPAEIKGYNETIDAFNKSLKNLGLDYVDLYLIHAPAPWSNIYQDCEKENIESWKAMIELKNKGLIKAIGVSNFHEKDIKPLILATGVIPDVNQIRYFIGNKQDKITNYCQDNNILIMAYSPLATGELTNHEKIKDLAKKYNKSISQICIRFCIQNNTLPIIKSLNPLHMKDNIDIDFVIDDNDMAYLNSLYHIASTRENRS